MNVLVALAWPNHVHHEVVRTWLEHNAHLGWATCPTTESGFVRISSNPVIPHAVTPPAALSMLGRLRDVDGHTFFTDDVSLVASPHVDTQRIASHRQVTDAHLLAIARRHDGRLATLDRGLRRTLARGEHDPSVVVIGADR